MCFPVLESTFGTAVAPVGANACLITSLTTQAAQPEIPRPDKTGSLGEIIGIPGRKAATWTAAMSMAGNGAPGVAPDCDKLLQLVFGKAPTIVGSASATYGLDDANLSASIWHYNDPSTVAQYVAIGAVCHQLKISFGGDVPTLEFTGTALWVLDTDQLADVTMDAIGKGGIASWTARPTPTVNGKPPAGFTGWRTRLCAPAASRSPWPAIFPAIRSTAITVRRPFLDCVRSRLTSDCTMTIPPT